MTDGIDLGPFDLVCTAQAKVEWLSDTDDIEIQACRAQFENHMDKLARQFQVIMAHKLRVALVKSHQCVEDTSFNALQGGKHNGGSK